MRSLDIGATGMLAQQMNVDVISNNIANMTTTGYKRQRVEFQDLFYQNLQRPGTTSSDSGTIVPAGIQIGLGVKPVSVYRLHGQGPLQNTGNDFDLAITGDGYFQVELPSGETAYTRSGSFQVNGDGELVTAQGYRLLPSISLPQNALGVDINDSGEVLVKIPNQIQLSNVGQLQLARFMNPTGMEAIGDSLFLETSASGSASVGNPNETGFGAVKQGILESSNVDVVQEITKLISAQRAYEMNSNIISTSDEMMATTSQLR